MYFRHIKVGQVVGYQLDATGVDVDVQIFVDAPYDRFVPAPGHGLGFNDLKVIECRELLAAIAGEPADVIGFDQGFEIEQAVDAMAQSHDRRAWVDIAYD